MKFYSVYDLETLSTKEINKVFLCKEAAQNFVENTNNKNKKIPGSPLYGVKEFEYIPTKEDIEKYKISAKRLDPYSILH